MPVRPVGDVLDIGGHKVARGQKLFDWIPVARRADGSTLGIPIMVVHGARPGKVLVVHSGVHGDEFEGMAAIEQVARELNAGEMAGTYIGVPCSNVPALDVGRRQGFIDNLDMNRVFPGTEHGYISHQLAHALFHEVIERCDCLIDIHSAGNVLMATSHVMYGQPGGKVDPLSMKMAMAYGTPYLYGSAPFKNVLRTEAVQLGISAITVEVGGEGRIREAFVAENLRGIRNNLKLLGIIPGELEGVPAEFELIEVGELGEYLFSKSGGRLLPEVKLGDSVDEGQVLGRVKDPLGNTLEEIRSTHSGVMMGMRTVGYVQPGDWTYFVARMVGRVSWE